MGINNVTSDLIGALSRCALSGTREGSGIGIFQVPALGFALVPHGARLDDGGGIHLSGFVYRFITRLSVFRSDLNSDPLVEVRRSRSRST